MAVAWTAAGVLETFDGRVPDLGAFTLHFSMPHRINAAGQLLVRTFFSRTPVWALLTPAELELVPLAPTAAGTDYVVDVHGARPGKPVFLVADAFSPSELGYRALPGGPLGVSMPAPRLVARATADANGDARLVWSVPTSLAGRDLRLQACQVGPTRVSQLVREHP